eukprot:493450-Amphidinium_carterae.2
MVTSSTIEEALQSQRMLNSFTSIPWDVIVPQERLLRIGLVILNVDVVGTMCAQENFTNLRREAEAKP